MPNDRLAHLVKDATRALLRALQMRLTAHEVSLGHWTFLRILWESDGITQRELSEQAGVMEPTTFSAIKAMEKLGYVARKQLPENRKNGLRLPHAEGPAAEAQSWFRWRKRSIASRSQTSCRRHPMCGARCSR